MDLPSSRKLDIGKLAGCFNSTSATYKFYWLLAIIQELESGKEVIPKINLFSRMVSNAWYTVNYFRVSFGQQDLIQTSIKIIKEEEQLTVDENKEVIYQNLISSPNRNTIRALKHFDNNVPHWFLAPWFPKISRLEIYSRTKSYENDCLYKIDSSEIQINPIWKNYILENSKILKDFCYWNLCLFLQSRNPNVPDIPNKLIKPVERKSLVNQRRFWDAVINEIGTVKCIYTGNNLSIGNYAVEHFIPYSFVSHDLIWNLIPAESRNFNSSKCDKLPSMENYFDAFYNLQIKAIQIMSNKKPKNKFLEDYLTIFPNIDSDLTKERFRDSIQPLITIASNNGFQFL